MFMGFFGLFAHPSLLGGGIGFGFKPVLGPGGLILGPAVFELEGRLSRYVCLLYCISCSSGTDALLFPLMASGIGPGDAVVTTPFPSLATAAVLSFFGAAPLFVALSEGTCYVIPVLIVPALLVAASLGFHVTAVMPVGLFGLPACFRFFVVFALKFFLIVFDVAARGFGGVAPGE
jgi:Predicted pyridoxal phosphate-dependent enzyme apparently involved in regulation of cell wall biogenesis